MFDPANIALIKKLGGGSGGGETSWNDLTDKPFGVEMGEAEITWDGNTSGLETKSLQGMTYAKVNVVAPTAESLFGHKVVIVSAQGDIVVDINTNSLDVADDGSYAIRWPGAAINVVIFNNGYYDTLTNGFWLFSVSGSGHVASVTYTAEVVKPLDPKYIVLTSPNGTKYNLSVSDSGTLSATAAT